MIVDVVVGSDVGSGIGVGGGAATAVRAGRTRRARGWPSAGAPDAVGVDAASAAVANSSRSVRALISARPQLIVYAILKMSASTDADRIEKTIGVMLLDADGKPEFVQVRALPSGEIDQAHLNEILGVRGEQQDGAPIRIAAGTTHVAVVDNAAPKPSAPRIAFFKCTTERK